MPDTPLIQQVRVSLIAQWLLFLDVRSADLAHLGHDISILLLGFRSWAEGSLQHCARVQVQGPEAHLLLSKLLFNHLPLMQFKLSQKRGASSAC